MKLWQTFVPQADEKIILTCHHDIWKLLPTVVVFVLLALTSFLAWWFTKLGGLLLGIAAVAFFVLIGGYLHWYFDVLVITDRRVALRRGVIGGTIKQAPLSKIQSTGVSQDLSGKLMRVGTLRMETGASGGGLEFSRLPNADTVSDRIQDLVKTRETIAREEELKDIKQQLRNRLRL